MRISDWSSDVCSSDLAPIGAPAHAARPSQLDAPDRLGLASALRTQPPATRNLHETPLLEEAQGLVRNHAVAASQPGDVGDRCTPRGFPFVAHFPWIQIERAIRRERVCQERYIRGGA